MFRLNARTLSCCYYEVKKPGHACRANLKLWA